MKSDNKLTISEILFIILVIEILMVPAVWLYQGHQGKQQFSAALTEIKAISGQTTPPTSSPHCSKITVSTVVDEHGIKQPIITCIISGNPEVRGKTLAYTRTHNGSWQCASNASAKFNQPNLCITLP